MRAITTPNQESKFMRTIALVALAAGWQLDFVGLQVIVLGVFVVFGLGLAYRSPSGNPVEPLPSTREDAEPGSAAGGARQRF